jgi:uncharacterized DUF497 family protein
MTDFEWDPEKAEANWLKHGIRFEDAARVFGGLMLSWSTRRGSEVRFASIGVIDGTAVVVFWTPRENVVRIFSARRAKRRERRRFDQEIGRSASARGH